MILARASDDAGGAGVAGDEGDAGGGEAEVHAVPQDDEEGDAVGGEEGDKEDVELVGRDNALGGEGGHAEGGEGPHERQAPAEHVGQAVAENMEEGKEKGGGGDIVAEVREDVLELVEEAAAEFAAHGAEGGEVGLQRAHDAVLGGAGAVDDGEDAEAEGIAADEVVAHEPRGDDDGIEEKDEQSADGARAEP